ncbi:MAG: hypothetical protein K1Y01_16560 [Vicinamibacteria bacterium]|nr:hypothetical protein [Vicinamibacteria bacterium]
MHSNSNLTFRAALADVAVIAVAISAAYGATALLGFALALPAPRVPILPVIAAAVIATRLSSAGFIAKLLSQNGK